METRSIRRMAARIETALTCFAVTLSGVAAWADKQSVTICIESGVANEAGRAQIIAGQMFARIGVRIEWYKENKCPAELAGVIHINVTTEIPANRFPGALAVALPYEGVHIRVFVDRIRKSVNPKIEPILLAHVLAHEITHILQGLSRHSESGIMKATWDPWDYEKMAWMPLPFTKEDVMLVRDGLLSRAARKARTQIAEESSTATAVQ